MYTLKAFYRAYPELAGSDLHLAGESYAGQYIPNIAHHFLQDPTLKTKLKGIAVGNGCWGGNETTVTCNGPCLPPNSPIWSQHRANWEGRTSSATWWNYTMGRAS